MEPSSGDDLLGQPLGDYVIDGVLGVGGMAKVYRAHDRLLQRDVAIKALLPVYLVGAEHVEHVERFRREAQRVAALDHPHIVPILHFIDNEQGLYLVMPLYAESLRERLKRAGRLSLAHALQIVKEIGSALSAAHAHGLIHRDVKPGNILLDEQGHAALADFGVAREASATGAKGHPDPLTLAGTGLTAGTPHYMAPEQLREAELDARADLYALGVVLYEMLTGRTPHLGGSQFEVGAAVLGGQIIPPSAISSDIPRAVEEVLLRALSLAAAQRYASVQDFVAALEEAGAHPARIAPDPALLSPLRRRWRGKRHTGHAHGAVAVGETDRTRRGRWLALELLALSVLLAIGGGWIALAGGRPPASRDGAAARVDSSGGQPTATQITPPTVTVSATLGSAPTATVADGQTTHTPEAEPSATPLATPPPLMLSPLHLTSIGDGQCEGSQTLHNGGTLTTSWQWVSVQPDLPADFAFGVNSPAQFGGFPADLYPGMPPGGTDVLSVRMACTGQNYKIALRDSFGNIRRVTMTAKQ
jgi:serine/threonine-protein kinase